MYEKQPLREVDTNYIRNEYLLAKQLSLWCNEVNKRAINKRTTSIPHFHPATPARWWNRSKTTSGTCKCTSARNIP